MQIHELNTFDGALTSGTYAAVDNGVDTGKISIPSLLKSATDAIEEANERIDNIITSPAPTDQEIIDARYGANGVTYQSLGAAIRGQISQIDGDINSAFDVEVSPNLLDSSAVSDGYLKSDGTVAVSGDWKTTDFIPVEYGETYTYSLTVIATGARSKSVMYFRQEYDSGKNIINGTYVDTATRAYTPISSNARYVRFSVHWYSTTTDRCFVKGSDIRYTAFGSKTFVLKNSANTIDVQKILMASPIAHSRNLFDKTKIIDGYISDSSGSITISGDWKTTDFIPVTYGKKYSNSNDAGLAGIYFALELDENYVPINYINTVTPPYTPSNASVKYIRFSQHEVSIPTMIFEEGDQWTGIFAPYGYDLTEYKGTLYKKKWVALGDSLTEKNQTAISNYTDFILAYNAMNLVNMGAGGTGYMRGYQTNEAFYQRAADIPSCDIITVFGSGNDLAYYSDLGNVTDTTTATICGCINKTFDIIFANHPTTPLLVIAPTPWAGNTPDMTTGMALYCERLREICSRRGIAYLDLFHHSGLRPNDNNQKNLVYYNDGDYVHPNKLGHSIIAPRIMRAMEEVALLRF